MNNHVTTHVEETTTSDALPALRPSPEENILVVKIPPPLRRPRLGGVDSIRRDVERLEIRFYAMGMSTIGGYTWPVRQYEEHDGRARLEDGCLVWQYGWSLGQNRYPL